MVGNVDWAPICEAIARRPNLILAALSPTPSLLRTRPGRAGVDTDVLARLSPTGCSSTVS